MLNANQPPHVVFDTTKSGVASETVKSFTSALGLPTVSASFGQEGDLRQWRDINKDKRNYLLQVRFYIFSLKSSHWNVTSSVYCNFIGSRTAYMRLWFYSFSVVLSSYVLYLIQLLLFPTSNAELSNTVPVYWIRTPRFFPHFSKISKIFCTLRLLNKIWNKRTMSPLEESKSARTSVFKKVSNFARSITLRCLWKIYH